MNEGLKKRLTSRKLHIFIVGFVTSTLFLYFGILPPDLWVQLIKWIFGIYVFGNGIEHITDKGIELRTKSVTTTE